MTEETIIIGAGPAGLACAAALRARGRSSTILEAMDRVASSWHGHYDHLHLHTSKTHSALPGQPMPTHFPRYPSRLQVIEYLEGYARANDLRILLGKRAVSIRRETDWVTETADGDQLGSRAVIIATGLSNTAVRPRWKGVETFAGPILHSSEYRNAATMDTRSVLIVGFGNSAGEIALECADAGLEVAMSVRGFVNVVALEMFGIPSATIAIVQRHLPPGIADAFNAPFLRLRFADLEALGLRRSSTGPLKTMVESGRTPLIDIGTIRRIRQGRIKVFPGIESSDGSIINFENGQSLECASIVLATGFRPSLEKLLPDIHERFPGVGRPKRHDLHPAGDGLYFCGFNPATTGLLREIGVEAEAISKSISARN